VVWMCAKGPGICKVLRSISGILFHGSVLHFFRGGWIGLGPYDWEGGGGAHRLM